MKRTLISLAVAGCFCAVLTACAVPEPQTIFKTVEAKVAVPVACKTDPVPKPLFALDQVKPSQGLYVKGKAALAEIQQRQAYETKLEAANKACQ